MLSPKMQDALNRQINAELFSSYLYLSMAAYFEAKDLKGMAHWMRIQAGEENGHAMRIFDFINDRSGRVSLTSIEAPKTEWNSPLDAFEDAYEARDEDHRHDQRLDERGGRRKGRRRAMISWNGSAESKSRKRLPHS